MTIIAAMMTAIGVWLVFAMGTCFGMSVGLCLSILTERWSKSAGEWIMRKISK